MKQRGFRYCNACNNKLRKNGKENNKQRWRCMSCGTANILKRPDLSERFRLHRFVDYILGMQARKNVNEIGSVLPWQLEKCWSVNPEPIVTGEIYPYLVVDAKHSGAGMTAIVRAKDFVVFWSHEEREWSGLWYETLRRLPRPEAVVSDGQKGIFKVLDILWPNIIVQRCLAHVQRNLHNKLTSSPKSEAGKDLRHLLFDLFRINTEDEMAVFVATFYELYDTHRLFIDQRTFYLDPQTGKQRWWYTHRGVRSSYRQLDRLLQSDQIFAYITHSELQLPKTTNLLEGGINSRLDELIYRHRGMSKEHQRRLIDWYLDSRSETPFLKRKNTKNGY